MNIVHFPTAISPSRRWQLCKTIKYWQPCRTQALFNRIQHLSNTAVKSGNEKVEQNSKPNRSPRLSPQLWSLLVNSRLKSPADDLVFLEKSISDSTKLTPEVNPLVVLLVTPSRLELLNDESKFIPKLLTLLFSNPNEVPNLDVLVAVIDKIPYPRPSELPDWKDKFQQKNGCEGISFMIGESEELAPDLWTARHWVGRQETTTTRQPCALSFRLKPNAQTMDSIAARSLKGNEASYEFQLPLANTLFHNGQVSTLYAERWLPSESAIGFSRVRQSSLPQQTLHIYTEARIKLNMMLTPIVPPRIVAAAMGNIIRQLYTSSGSNPEATVPASKELEVAVSRYIELSQDPTQKTDIWALVIPREYRKSGPWVWPNPRILFENGSRLHKVLSGGGGWGIKEGLLALDPDCDYDYPEHDTEMDFGDGQIKDYGEAQSCRNIVRPGDLVAFLAPNPLVEPRRSESEPSESLNSWVLNTSSSVVFGTLPSTLDAMPDSDSASCQPNLPFDHLLARNHLGILSENGMSIKIYNHGFDDSAKSGEKHGLVVQTKLDAPYTLFFAVPPKLENFQKEEVEIQKDIVKTASDAKHELDIGDQSDTEDRLVARRTMLNMMYDLEQVLATSKNRRGSEARLPEFKVKSQSQPATKQGDRRVPDAEVIPPTELSENQIALAKRISSQFVMRPTTLAKRISSQFHRSPALQATPIIQTALAKRISSQFILLPTRLATRIAFQLNRVSRGPQSQPATGQGDRTVPSRFSGQTETQTSSRPAIEQNDQKSTQR